MQRCGKPDAAAYEDPAFDDALLDVEEPVEEQDPAGNPEATGCV